MRVWHDGKVFVDVEDKVQWEKIKNKDFSIKSIYRASKSGPSISFPMKIF